MIVLVGARFEPKLAVPNRPTMNPQQIRTKQDVPMPRRSPSKQALNRCAARASKPWSCRLGSSSGAKYPRLMIVPIILLMFSVAGVAVALIMPGMTDLIMLAGPCALASLLLLLSAYLRGRVSRSQVTSEWMMVDGSNVMHWKDGAPDIATVREVVDHLSRIGFSPGVVFDANAGYKFSGRYQNDRALGKLLGLPRDRVIVVPKGTPADPTILAASRDLRARIVTNDRFRDWAETYPEASKPGYLIRGGYRAGKLWLALPARS